jgi:hypothetical protein
MQATPIQTLNNGLPDRILDVLPNPAAASASDALSRKIAIVTPEGLALLDVGDGKLTGPVQGQITCGKTYQTSSRYY